jgi:hypothetical protein
MRTGTPASRTPVILFEPTLLITESTSDDCPRYAPTRYFMGYSNQVVSPLNHEVY